MIDGKKDFSINQYKMTKGQIITIEKLRQVKEMITQLVPCWTMFILNTIRG